MSARNMVDLVELGAARVSAYYKSFYLITGEQAPPALYEGIGSPDYQLPFEFHDYFPDQFKGLLRRALEARHLSNGNLFEETILNHPLRMPYELGIATITTAMRLAGLEVVSLKFAQQSEESLPHKNSVFDEPSRRTDIMTLTLSGGLGTCLPKGAVLTFEVEMLERAASNAHAILSGEHSYYLSLMEFLKESGLSSRASHRVRKATAAGYRTVFGKQ